MKTAKITSITEIKPFVNSFGTTYYHSLVMDNGDKIQIGKKAEMKVGFELTYEIVDDQQEYNKAKSVQKEQASTQPTGQPQKTYTDNSDAILFQVALKVACELIAKDLTTKIPSAESLVDYAFDIAKLSKVKIAELKTI